MRGSRRAAALLAIVCCSDPVRASESLEATYDDAFTLRSPDEAYSLAMRGGFHLDARTFQGENVGAPGGFDLRRARLELAGRLQQRFTFRLQTELAGSPYVRNAWLDCEAAPWLHARAGQMKIPLSSAWLTEDGHLHFIERGMSQPFLPFFDRGLTLWGELPQSIGTYQLGVFAGAGPDVDASASDVDRTPELSGRVFLQPLRLVDWKPARGLYVAFQEDVARSTVPTNRNELGGLRAADYESAIWRWRTEQVLGTNGRSTDETTARIHSRLRWGAEAHYLFEWLALSAEFVEVRYRDVELTHQLRVGSRTSSQVPVLRRSGRMRALTLWASVYLTGESKRLDAWGWKTAQPRRPIDQGGWGAMEVLGRYSRLQADTQLFEGIPVDGFAAEPGDGERVSAAVLDGAHDVHEATVGVSWTLTRAVRLQLNDVLLWAPSVDRNGDGTNDNQILSGAKSSQADGMLRGVPTTWENAVLGRLIVKI